MDLGFQNNISYEDLTIKCLLYDETPFRLKYVHKYIKKNICSGQVRF